VLAKDVGTPAERKRTKKVTLDLRIPLCEPGLLFIRSSEAGRALLERWRAECQQGSDERLAFLRALHIVKPKFCALPRSWLAEEAQRAKQDARAATSMMRRGIFSLVRVEISPGRFVKCRAGDEDKVREQFNRQRGRKRRGPAEDKKKKKGEDKGGG